MKPIAVLGCTLAHVDPVPPAIPITGGAFTIVPATESMTVKAEGKGVYSNTIKFSFIGGNYTGATPGSVQTPTGVFVEIPASSLKVKADGSFVVLEKDFVTMNCICVPIPPAVSPVSCVGIVEVASAGQTKVKAN